jgi:hypothetical protein
MQPQKESFSISKVEVIQESISPNHALYQRLKLQNRKGMNLLSEG